MTLEEFEAIKARQIKNTRGITVSGPEGFADGTWEGQMLQDIDVLIEEVSRLTYELCDAELEIHNRTVESALEAWKP